ncbi:MAG: hypothetical protein H6672_00495 [Anaerolineaceae bacterium]|nr:hypothetical protein [Anaerolineaceae bacterium]
MQPGLNRAVPMGILGFLLGALIVVILRGLQSLDPLWETGPGLVLAVFMGAGFFVYGMGAFDPKMNVHGEPDEATPAAPDGPFTILSGYMWKITTAIIILFVVVFGIATIPSGPVLRSVHQADGAAEAVGMVPVQLPFGGPTVEVSQLTIFAVFVVWMLLSLFAAAAAVGLLIRYLSTGAKNPEGTNIPWRVLIFVGILASLLGLPLLFPTFVFPTPALMPFVVVPLLALTIAYKSRFWLLLLVLSLLLPLLVSEIQLSDTVYWLNIAVLAFFLLLPVSLLKRIIPRPIWNKFASINWSAEISGILNGIVHILRGVPPFLGQR